MFAKLVCTNRLRFQRAASVITDLLGERSQLNSYKKHIFGLFAYASGATRQMISVMNMMGVSSSYPTLAGTQKRTGALDFTIPRPGGQENVLDPVTAGAGTISAPTPAEERSDEELDSDGDSDAGASPVQQNRELAVRD